MKLNFLKNGKNISIEGRSASSEDDYLVIGGKYFDLTSDVSKTNYNNIKFIKGGVTKYIKTSYFSASSQYEQFINTYRFSSGNNPNPWEITKSMEGYNNICIGINSNIVLSGVYDRSGSSTNENYRWKWKFYNMVYDYFHSSENDHNHITTPIPTPDNVDLSSLEALKKCEWYIEINRSVLSSSWKEIWSKSYSGGGRTVAIKISGYIDNSDILHIKFETFSPGTGGRKTATCGKHIKMGVITY